MRDHVRHASRRRYQPQVDSLEGRQLLSADVWAESVVAPGAPVPAQSPGPTVGNAGIDALIGATLTRQKYGVDGSGLTAAVIDTGVNYNHEAFGGGLGAGHTVVGGYDFGDRDNDPDATGWDHGTAVAGLIASRDPSAQGIAPGASIAALRVFNSANKGDYNWIAGSLQWVIDHHDEFNISVVNLSLSDSRNYATDWFSEDTGMGQRISGLITQLRALDIPVVSAAGNSFNGQEGMGFTAILPQTISVTATTATDDFVSNAQRLGTGKSATDLAAPGSGVVAPTGSSGFMSVEGTSFAAPVVTGSILLLQDLYQSRFGTLPTVDQLESWLKGGANAVNDPVTGITLGRLNIAAAAAMIPAAPNPQPQIPNPTPTPEPTPTPTPTPEPTPPEVVPQTKIYRGGQLVGEVDSNSAENPLRDAAAQFGLEGTIQTVRIWSARGKSNTIGSAQVVESRREAVPERRVNPTVPRGASALLQLQAARQLRRQTLLSKLLGGLAATKPRQG